MINKTDLAPYVGASLEVMERDTLRMRGERPWSFTNLKSGDGLQISSPLSKTKACSASNPCTIPAQRCRDGAYPALSLAIPFMKP